MSIPETEFYPNREEAAAALQEGQVQLEMLTRQAALGRMFPSAKSVME